MSPSITSTRRIRKLRTKSSSMNGVTHAKPTSRTREREALAPGSEERGVEAFARRGARRGRGTAGTAPSRAPRSRGRRARPARAPARAAGSRAARGARPGGRRRAARRPAAPRAAATATAPSECGRAALDLDDDAGRARRARGRATSRARRRFAMGAGAYAGSPGWLCCPDPMACYRLRNPRSSTTPGVRAARCPSCSAPPSPSAEPWAELWLGAHARAPSEVLVGARVALAARLDRGAPGARPRRARRSRASARSSRSC